MKKVFLLLFFVLLHHLLYPQEYSNQLHSDSTFLKPDYRNHINIPEYNKTLMPLQKVSTGSGTWTELNPKVPRVDYLGVDFVDSLTGWSVGANGAIIKTTNGGKKWESIESGTTNVLTHVNTFNGNIVIAVGFEGTIIRSIDGGETWNSITTPAVVDLWRVQMLNDTLGWISGTASTLLRTTDGGLSWQSIFTGYPQNYWSLSFLNENVGYICCSNGYILKTTDGGSNWQQQNVGDDYPLYCITVLDTQTIVTGGFGRIVTSYNGGNNWSITGLGGVFYSIAFSDSLNGIALNDMGGHHYKTTDRGVTWELVDSYSFPNNWIDFINESTGIAVGNGVNLQKTTDGGVSWVKMIMNDDFYDVFFINETKGFALSFFSLYLTTDGGTNWQKKEAAPGGYDILFLDSTVGFICGNQFLYKTTDSGDNWYQTNTLGLSTSKIFFITNRIGWVLSGEKILKTTDNGENWAIQIQTTNAFTSIFFVDTLNGWATSKYIWQTTDGGDKWIQRTYLPSDTHDDVYFANIDTGWISNYSSINTSLFKTTDGGENWSEISEVVGSRKFHFFPDPIHWIVLGFSRYYITNDRGNSWTEFTNNVPSGLSGFQAPNNLLGYAVGSSGLFLRYDDTTFVPIELVSFEGKIENNKIVLLWITASELNNQGFYIEKSHDKINWETIGFVNGNGTTTETSYYNFVDKDLVNEENNYRLKQVDFNESYTYSRITTVYFENTLLTFELFQNYPNPFNPNTTIKYTIPKTGVVNISLYSILGDKINELINEEKQPGIYTITLDANNLSSGIYFYKLITGSGYTAVKKLTIIK